MPMGGLVLVISIKTCLTMHKQQEYLAVLGAKCDMLLQFESGVVGQPNGGCSHPATYVVEKDDDDDNANYNDNDIFFYFLKAF